MFWKKYFKPYKWQGILGFFFKLVEAFFELMVPVVVAKIIDQGIAKGNTTYIIHMGIVMFVLALAGYGSAIICQYFASLTSQGMGTLMRRDMFEAINNYDYEDLDTLGTPTLITRITNDVNQLQLAIAMTIRLLSRSPFIIIGSLVMAFILNWQVGLVFLVISPLIALAIYFVMSRTQPIYHRINKLMDKISLITRENLSGVRVIRAFNKQENEKKRFIETTKTQKDEQVHAGYLSSLMNPATTVIVNTGIILILYVSAIKVNLGTLTQGEVIALINYMNAIMLSMYAFANVILIYVKATAASQRVQEVLSLKPNMIEGSQDMPDSYNHLITFDDVSFSYKEGQALEHLSFTINEGETVGIIGGTGSGKSTLVNLIPRFYDATEGRILIKDQPIEDYHYDTLRHMIGIVPQSATLFSGTIKENLLWGNSSASDEDLNNAIKISQAKEFIDKLPDGLKTKIEAGGKNVSCGQRQRLTIARALVRKPEILILDDSASALDFATDAKLRRDIKKMHATSIIVSQRVSAIMNSDKILVLDHGKLAAMGTHDELLQTCTLYQEIVKSQMEGENNEK